MYIDDLLGERVWVDRDDCKGFVDNIVTAFTTKASPKHLLVGSEPAAHSSLTPGGGLCPKVASIWLSVSLASFKVYLGFCRGLSRGGLAMNMSSSSLSLCVCVCVCACACACACACIVCMHAHTVCVWDGGSEPVVVCPQPCVITELHCL